MERSEFEKKLEQIGACYEAREFCNGKSLQYAWEQCERGDWMLWLYKRANNFDTHKLHLAKGYCAETVIHLMKDERSKSAVKAAIDFGNKVITIDELSAAAAAAAYAAYAAYAASYAAYAAADAAAAYADAAYAASYAAAAAADAEKQNKKLTADICRKYLPIPTFN